LILVHVGPRVLPGKRPEIANNSISDALPDDSDRGDIRFSLWRVSPEDHTVKERLPCRKMDSFQYFRANSSLETHEPINVDMTDSCAYAGKVVDTTWLQSFLWNLNEKAAATGKTGHSSKFALKHR
jgi:hypothetical protein